MIAAEMRADESDTKEGEEDEPKADMFTMEKPTASQMREAQTLPKPVYGQLSHIIPTENTRNPKEV